MPKQKLQIMLDRLHLDDHYSHVTPVSGIDWELISKIDPKMLADKNLRKQLNKFINELSSYTVTKKDCDVLSHPLSLRYFLLTQKGISLLIDENENLKEKYNNAKEENHFLRTELKRIRNECENSEKRMRLIQDFVTCPTCNKRFQNIEYLDMHFSRHHNQLSDCWIRIRNNEFFTKTDEEIASLNDKIYHLNKKIEEQNIIINQLQNPIYITNKKKSSHKQNITISAVAIQPKHPPGIAKVNDEPINSSQIIKELYSSDSEENSKFKKEEEYEKVRKHLELSLASNFPIPIPVGEKNSDEHSRSSTNEDYPSAERKQSSGSSSRKPRKHKLIFDSVSGSPEKSSSRSPVRVERDSETDGADPFVVESSIHDVSSDTPENKKDRFISESFS